MLSHRLRHRVQFQALTETRNTATGERIKNWLPAVAGGVQLVSVPAEVLTGSGKEAVKNASPTADIAARINVRWFPGLDPSWRIVWDGLIFNIASWDTDIAARREYRIKCSAFVDK